jgi:hypothetical protein
MDQQQARIIIIRVDRRTFDMAQMRATGDYAMSYCEQCDCPKSQAPDIPNRRTEACNDPQCCCHSEEDW